MAEAREIIELRNHSTNRLISTVFAVVVLHLGALPWVRANDGARLKVLVVKTRDIPFYAPPLKGFTDGLRNRGYRPGERVALTTIALSGNKNQDMRLLTANTETNPDLVITLGTDATRLVAATNPSYPVIFSMVIDPITLNVAKTLDNPGGRFTGTTLVVSPGKQIETLLQAVPKVRRIGVLYTDKDATSLFLINEARDDAKRLNVEIVAIAVPEAYHVNRSTLEGFTGKVDALWLVPDSASTGQQALMETFDYARQRKIPILGASSATVKLGALVALSANLEDLGDLTAEMAVRVLDGSALPGDLRIRGPRRTGLAINLATARDLGVNIPRSVLQLADEVIEQNAGGQ